MQRKSRDKEEFTSFTVAFWLVQFHGKVPLSFSSRNQEDAHADKTYPNSFLFLFNYCAPWTNFTKFEKNIHCAPWSHFTKILAYFHYWTLVYLLTTNEESFGNCNDWKKLFELFNFACLLITEIPSLFLWCWKICLGHGFKNKATWNTQINFRNFQLRSTQRFCWSVDFCTRTNRSILMNSKSNKKRYKID